MKGTVGIYNVGPAPRPAHREPPALPFHPAYYVLCNVMHYVASIPFYIMFLIFENECITGWRTAGLANRYQQKPADIKKPRALPKCRGFEFLFS